MALNWTGDNEFVLDGVSYVSTGLPTGDRSTAERFRIIKSRWLVDRYERLIAENGPQRIVELGIYDGGSTAFIVQLARPQKLVAVELATSPCHALETFVDAHGLRDVVATYYGVNQADAPRLGEIVDREFGDGGIDLVIDDASHRVDETRASFNALFPRVRPGGLYVIEDWSWAHNAMVPARAVKERATPLSILVFELMVSAAHNPDVIEGIEIKKGTAVLRRGSQVIDGSTFDVSASYGSIGQELVRGLVDSWAVTSAERAGGVA